jgi:hypothetical protein
VLELLTEPFEVLMLLKEVDAGELHVHVEALNPLVEISVLILFLCPFLVLSPSFFSFASFSVLFYLRYSFVEV